MQLRPDPQGGRPSAVRRASRLGPMQAFLVAALALLVAPVVRAAPLTATIQFKTPTKVFTNDDCNKLVDYLEPKTRGKATSVECLIQTYPLGEVLSSFVLLEYG